MYIEVIDEHGSKDLIHRASAGEELLTTQGSIEEWTEEVKQAKKKLLKNYEDSIGRYAKGQSNANNSIKKTAPKSLIAIAFNKVLL